MFQKRLMAVLSLLIVLSMVLAACTETVTVVETQQVKETEIVEIVNTQVVEVVNTEIVEVVEVVEVTPTPVPSTRKGGWVDQIVFVDESNAQAAVTRLQAGEIDIYAYSVSDPDLYRTVQEDPGLDYINAVGSYNEYSFNTAPFTDATKLNPFSNPKIREAVNWIIDRNYLVQEIVGGLANPKLFCLNSSFPDYAVYADIARALENQYAYNPEKGNAVIAAEMEAMGATLVDGKWNFGGAPIVIVIIIRTEDERMQLGDYLGTRLEEAGFTVDRQYKTRTEASPIWVQSNPADGLWNVYTGGWISTQISRDDGSNFSFFYGPYDYPIPLHMAYVNDPAFEEVYLKLRNNEFATLEERRELFAVAMPLSLQDSARVWIYDELSFSPFRSNVSVAYDLAAGIAGSRVYPYTVRFVGQEGGVMRIAQPGVLVDPWNPIAGSNWIYDSMPIRATADVAIMPDPYTGLQWPQRIESASVVAKEGLPIGKTLDWVDLSFEAEIAVPADALVDWDATNQVFITAGEKFTQTLTANIKSTVVYPADLFETITWHDGSPLDVADFVYGMILTFDFGKAESANFDEAQAGSVEQFLSYFKGFKIISENPLTIEYYTDLWYLDAELNVYTLWPNYAQGPGAWHNVAVGALADAAKELAFSADKADAEGIEWMSYISGPSLEILKKYLDQAAAESYIPYAPTMGMYITAEEAAARYANLTAWYEARNNFWLGTGPYYLYQVYPVEQTLTLQRNPNYPDMADKWSGFGEPKLAVVEIDGAGSITKGAEAAFDVYVTYKDAPYPAAEIKGVTYLVFDSAGTLVTQGVAEFVADGQYIVKLSADVTNGMASGAYKLEATAVSLLVAIPTFVAFEFIVP
jgi:peptide/nickel transport system substrate-binding protein